MVQDAPGPNSKKLVHPGEPLTDVFRRVLTDSHVARSKAPLRVPLANGAFPSDLLANVQPVVPDANVLRNDVIYACRSGTRTVLVNIANAGLLRLFCARHVLDEVSEHAAEWAEGAKIPVEQFLTQWEREYLPFVRVLDASIPSEWLSPDESRRMAALAEIDPDDVPSASLALALGGFYLSQDKTALRAVYGDGIDPERHAAWVDLLKAGGDAGQLAELGQVATGLVSAAVSGMAGGAARLLESAGPVGAVCLGMLSVLLLANVPPKVRQRVWSGARVTLGSFAHLLAVYEEAHRRFATVTPGTPKWAELALTNEPTAVLARACLHVVSRSGIGDRSAAEITATLPPLGIAQGEAKVREVLRSHGCFTEPWRGRWQVGGVAVGQSD